MTTKSGLSLTIWAVIISILILFYEVMTQTGALILMPIGLGMTFIGIFMMIRNKMKK